MIIMSIIGQKVRQLLRALRDLNNVITSSIIELIIVSNLKESFKKNIRLKKYILEFI